MQIKNRVRKRTRIFNIHFFSKKRYVFTRALARLQKMEIAKKEQKKNRTRNMIFFIDNRFGMESRTALLENPNIQFVNTFWPIAVGGGIQKMIA